MITEYERRARLNDLEPMRDRLLRVLHDAMEERPNRTDWIEYERDQMTAAVNHARFTRGLQAATADDIRTIEDTAVGHSDYAAKLALRCAELALGIRAAR
ncbi:hypothetical protein [Nocardiopsis sp. NRRL B-16309]|uniref:hypothetical protein n=1 Tax=Nocardiopsis sp. NRRL B-16309 TaxID=1519494 RepID=UPI0006ADD34E|nr:hypothetical protein [Nocardiopsis sp. NRRL B-16309]KOX10169.1 hypothetical protein ADL05_26210 [Nocardiopsis sp. NRRL B-16309]